jgi:hypothetical protein
MSEVKLKLLEWRSSGLVLFVVLPLLGRSHLLVLYIRACIIIAGLIDVRRLALAVILSSDFALDFAFLFRNTLKFLQDPERVMTHRTQDLATAPDVAPMTMNATTTAGAESAFDIGLSGLTLFLIGREGKLSPMDLTKRIASLPYPTLSRGVPSDATSAFAFMGT